MQEQILPPIGNIMLSATAILLAGCCHLLEWRSADVTAPEGSGRLADAQTIHRAAGATDVERERAAIATELSVGMWAALCDENACGNMQLMRTEEGDVASIAVPGHGVGMGIAPGKRPQQVAQLFFENNAAAFGITHQRLEWKPGRAFCGKTHILVHLHQELDGIPVVGSDARLQYRPDGAVFEVSVQAVRDSAVLEAENTFPLSREDILAAAAKHRDEAATVFDLEGAETAEQVWFVPRIMKTGAGAIPQPAWHVHSGAEEFYLHAKTGAVLLRAPIVYPTTAF